MSHLHSSYHSALHRLFKNTWHVYEPYVPSLGTPRMFKHRAVLYCSLLCGEGVRMQKGEEQKKKEKKKRTAPPSCSCPSECSTPPPSRAARRRRKRDVHSHTCTSLEVRLPELKRGVYACCIRSDIGGVETNADELRLNFFNCWPCRRISTRPEAPRGTPPSAPRA